MILRIGDEYFVFILSSAPLKKYTSWKSLAISQTRHCCASTEVIWQLCLSARKKSRSTGVCINDCTIQFIKQVFPKLIKPLKPEKNRNQTGTYFQRNLLSKTMLKRPDIEMKSKLNSFYIHLVFKQKYIKQRYLFNISFIFWFSTNKINHLCICWMFIIKNMQYYHFYSQRLNEIRHYNTLLEHIFLPIVDLFSTFLLLGFCLNISTSTSLGSQAMKLYDFNPVLMK